MKRILLACLMLALASIACSLGSTAADDTEDIPELRVTQPVASQTPAPTSTSQPTNTPSSTSGNNNNNNSGSGSNLPCTVRTDWTFVYAVARGDTLSSIARRANTTVATLSTGNCISDPNLLEVGQVLRTPNLVTNPVPPTITPFPTQGIPNDNAAKQFIDALCADENRPDAANYALVLPVLSYNNGCATIADTDTVTITWPGVPNGATEVIYLMRYPNTMQPVEIGRSSDVANKFPLTVPATRLMQYGLLYGWQPFGQNANESDHLAIRVIDMPETVCGDIQGAMGGPNPIIITPSTQHSEGCVRVAPGSVLTITWPFAPPEAVEVTFYRMNSRMTRPDVIGVDNDPTDGWGITWSVFDSMPPTRFYAIPTGGSYSSAEIGVLVGN